MDVNQFFRKKYDIETYNCGHFVCEVWEHLTGENIQDLAEAFRTNDLQFYRPFHSMVSRLVEPVDPCLVVMRSIDPVPHVGVYMQDKVLHICESGVRFQTISDLEKTQTLSYFK